MTQASLAKRVFVLGMDGAGNFIQNTDTAAVVAHALGLVAPSTWDAKLPETLFTETIKGGR